MAAPYNAPYQGPPPSPAPGGVPGPSGGVPGASRQGRPVVAVFAWITAACTVVGSLLPLTSGADSLFEAADSRFVVFVLLGVGLLVVAGAIAAGQQDAAGLAGGAGLIIGTTFGFFSSFFISLINDFGGDMGAGTILLAVAAGLGWLTFFLALASPARRSAQSVALNWLAPVGVISGVLAAIGLVFPPPDFDIALKDYLNTGYALANVMLVTWYCTLAIAALVGFLSRRRWGILLAFGAYVPMAWIGFTTIVDLAQDDAGPGGLGRVFAEDIHPLFGIGLVGMGVAVVVGLFSGGGAAAAAPAAKWAADPFGRFEYRYWDGRTWTDQVSRGGVPYTDAPVWGQGVPAAPFQAATAAMPAVTPGVAPTPAPWQPSAPGQAWQAPASPTGQSTQPSPPPTPPLGFDPLHDGGTIVAPWGASPFRLVLEDGTRHPITSLMLLGRDPAPLSGDPPATLVAVADPARSVSKTHLALGWSGGVLWAADRGSTNGTSLIGLDGGAAPLTANERVPVQPGMVLQMGDRKVWIVQEGG